MSVNGTSTISNFEVMVKQVEENTVYQKMHELETEICYHFNRIDWLAKAMRSEKIYVPGKGKNHDDHANEALATVGDAMLKAVIADYLYQKDVSTKGKITQIKSELENNAVMHKIMLERGLIRYAYNDKHFQSDSNVPEHEKVVSGKHDSYIEAIVGAVFYDSDYNTVKKWIEEWLLPLLRQYANVDDNK